MYSLDKGKSFCSQFKDLTLGKNDEERRKEYRCGSNFKTLSDIPNWIEFTKGYEFSKKFPELKKADEDNGLAKRISLFSGDITCLEIDVIANAANSGLRGGGGVDGAIHRAAGPQLIEDCRKLNGCDTGSAKITLGHKLPAKFVIHCVGPMGVKPDLLKSTYKTALELCTENELKSIAFPCISTGVYGYPSNQASPVAIDTVLDYLKNHQDIERVIFCVFLPEDYALYVKLLSERLG